MGGRGTYAIGNNVKYQYETVDKIDGIKVLKGKEGSGKHGLPEESHSSEAYISRNPNGKVRQLDSTMKTILQGLITTSQCTKEKYYCTPMIIKTESA